MLGLISGRQGEWRTTAPTRRFNVCDRCCVALSFASASFSKKSTSLRLGPNVYIMNVVGSSIEGRIAGRFQAYSRSIVSHSLFIFPFTLYFSIHSLFFHSLFIFPFTLYFSIHSLFFHSLFISFYYPHLHLPNQHVVPNHCSYALAELERLCYHLPSQCWAKQYSYFCS